MTEPSPHRRTFDPPRPVRVRLPSGKVYRGIQFEWVRWPTGEWRAGVRYTTAPGATYIRSVPADQIVAETDLPPYR